MKLNDGFRKGKTDSGALMRPVKCFALSRKGAGDCEQFVRGDAGSLITYAKNQRSPFDRAMALVADDMCATVEAAIERLLESELVIALDDDDAIRGAWRATAWFIGSSRFTADGANQKVGG